MWNAVNDKDENDTDFARFLLEYPYKAQQTGFVQPYADSPLDGEKVGEESLHQHGEQGRKILLVYDTISDQLPMRWHMQ